MLKTKRKKEEQQQSSGQGRGSEVASEVVVTSEQLAGWAVKTEGSRLLDGQSSSSGWMILE